MLSCQNRHFFILLKFYIQGYNVKINKFVKIVLIFKKNMI